MKIGDNARAAIVHFSHQIKISYKDRKMSSLMHVATAGVAAMVAAGAAAAHTHTRGVN